MNKEQKNELVKATKSHVAQDLLIRGTYGKSENDVWKGCSAACLARDIKKDADEDELHSLVSNYYGYPQWLVYLQDTLFENASEDIHVKLAEAMRPRDNWQSVMHMIHCRILQEVTLPVAGKSADVVKTVIDLHKAEKPAESAEWSEAWAAARSEAWAEASSAEWSAARSAARSAEWSAAAAAAAAAAASEAWSAAAAWETIMNIVLEEVAK